MDEQNKLIEKLREQYIKNPPEGMTTSIIRRMSDDDLPDMSYFLDENLYGDDIGEEGFYIIKIYAFYSLRLLLQAFFVQKFSVRRTFL